MLLDLSATVDANIPVYPGDPVFRAEKTGGFDSDGYEGHLVHMGTHVGTHIDAPAHMLPGGKTIDQFPPETFAGEAVCVTGFDLAALEAAGVQAGGIVLFYTGMSERYNDPAYFTDYPVMSEDTAAWLVKKQVKLVGLDTCSADNTPGFPVHKKLLGADILIIENLTNLAQLAGKRCRLTALPLKLSLDAAPARVIAEIAV